MLIRTDVLRYILSIYSIDIEDPLFKYYQLERKAAWVNLFKNIIIDESLALSTIVIFNRLKSELIEVDEK